MNNSSQIIITAFAIVIFLNACVNTPQMFEGAEDVRARLTKLQGNSALAEQSPMAMQDASIALLAAEHFREDSTDANHFLYIAERRVDIAEADSKRHYFQQEYQRLRAELGAMQILIAANKQLAEPDSYDWKTASARRSMLNSVRVTPSETKSPQSLNMRREERGLVMIFNNVFLKLDQTELTDNAITRLSGLVEFLSINSDYLAVIEGHTDNLNTDELNTLLSLERAEAVKGYLRRQGVSENRMTTSGKGGRVPIKYSANEEQGYYDNRIEIIINAPAI